LTEADLDYFASEFARTGFRGGINRYRNLDRDWAELPQLADARVTQPALFIAGERDLTLALNPHAVEALRRRCDDLRDVIVLPGAGHWTQQERPAEVNAALLAFLDGL
jgi:pimeloyl-ACP methyl ester carboxylesterase